MVEKEWRSGGGVVLDVHENLRLEQIDKLVRRIFERHQNDGRNDEGQHNAGDDDSQQDRRPRHDSTPDLISAIEVDDCRCRCGDDNRDQRRDHEADEPEFGNSLETLRIYGKHPRIDMQGIGI